ncbi:MAG: DUF4339 domain-containing protein [Thermoguttaceae bacterium]|jgi:hypothetical protein
MALYYFQEGEKLGPVNSAQLRALVRTGVVTPDTIIEKKGRLAYAREVKGLKIPPPTIGPEMPPAIPPVVEEEGPVFVPGADRASVSGEAEELVAASRWMSTVGVIFVLSGGAGFFLGLLYLLALIFQVSVIPEVAVGCIAGSISCMISGLVFLFLGALGRFLVSTLDQFLATGRPQNAAGPTVSKPEAGDSR